MSKEKKTIVFDFDGVIHLGYEGWKDGTIYGTINWRLLDYIEELLEDYYVVISTNRPAQQIVDYFEKIKENIEPLKFEVFKKDLDKNMYWNKDNVIGVTNEKAVGILYIDDRGFRYDKEKDSYENIYNINKILGRKDKGFRKLDGMNCKEAIQDNYINKDKIKAKIEELEKDQEDNRKKLYDGINNLNFKEIDKISDRISVNMSVRDILQSLLKEK